MGREASNTLTTLFCLLYYDETGRRGRVLVGGTAVTVKLFLACRNCPARFKVDERSSRLIGVSFRNQRNQFNTQPSWNLRFRVGSFGITEIVGIMLDRL